MTTIKDEKKIKIVVVSTYGTYPELNNGPPIVAYNLIKNWSKEVADIYLFTGVNQMKKVPDQYDDMTNLHVYLIKKDWCKNTCENTNESDYIDHISSLKTPLKYLLKTPTMSYRLYKQIRGIDPDILFYNGLPLDPLAAVPLLFHLHGLPQIARVPVYHPIEFQMKSKCRIVVKMAKILYDTILLSMNLIITQSEDMLKELIKNNKLKSKCIIIPNGVDINPQNRVNKDNIKLLFTGNISKEKGIEILIESLSHISKELHPVLELILVGKGDYEYIKYLKTLAKNSKINIPIIFVGEIPHEDINKYYYDSDIFIFPSLHEGMSLSLLEAMGAGIPVIASNIRANSEIITDGWNGLLFEKSNPIHLAICLERIIGDKELQQYLSKNAYDSIKEFSWDKISNRYLDIFRTYLRNEQVINYF